MPQLYGGGAAAHADLKLLIQMTYASTSLDFDVFRHVNVHALKRAGTKIAEMESVQIENIDPVTEFIACKQDSGYECELFKENARPLKRGRNVGL
ncbi:hypothetical protein LWI28_001567 [Acer negundo]|uniref:Uncharacterized protein n=1 Tax=Acer negundo TaxID=4023 RepID=A0AAD5JS57_ACENE|nr:hypothetical protein LWI28_001567 [Acer negundo]